MASEGESGISKYGLRWSQVHVTRLSEIARPNGVYRILRVNDLDIYVSPSGRTRVFRGNDELVRLVIPKTISRKCPECPRIVKERMDGKLHVHRAPGSKITCKGA